MMSGQLYVDGKDAYLQYGVYVVEGGWNELIAFPPMKTVDTNDWQEEDGVEADLSDPKLDTNEVQLKIACSGLYSRFFEFLNLLSDGAYHVFNVESIGRTFNLRLSKMPDYSRLADLGTCTLKVYNDFPSRENTIQAPSSSIMQDDEYSIDGIQVTQYGLRLLKGTMAEILRGADVKSNLTRNIATKDGATYDGETVTYSQKEVKLYCLMRAETLEELWHNYDALLSNLTLSDERMLYVSSIEQTFPFYYEKCEVTRFYPTGKIWLEFTLTIVFTGSFRIDSEDFVLASEDGRIVYTEDNENAIEMRPGSHDVPSASDNNSPNS